MATLINVAGVERSNDSPYSPADLGLYGVTKTFRSSGTVVRDLTFQCKAGETTCLLGPSGCGKSTALRLMAGLTEPDEGRVERPETTAVSFVFQDATLMPWRRVIDNVRLPLSLRGESRAESELTSQRALESVGLADRLRAYPRQLSGGMKMRVSLARALVTNPTVLLMDEPFAALDEQTRFRLNDDVLRLVREHAMTVVFVTHSVFEAAYLADTVVVMSAGPGRVSGTHRIDVAGERDASFRSSSDYAHHSGQISAMLQRAASGEGGA